MPGFRVALRSGLWGAALLSGCATFEGSRGLVPLVEVYHDREDTLFPLSSVASRSREEPSAISVPPPGPPPTPIGVPPREEVVVRPLGSYGWGADYSRLLVLWPVADFARQGAERREWVLPFWYRQDRPTPQAGRDRRWMFFPFFFGGQNTTEGSYFAFLPVAGKLRGILTFDEIDFYLFPVYWHSRQGEGHSLHLLFPFYNRIWGAGRSGARLWPFYGRYRAVTADGRERYERKFILWPLYIHQRTELNTLHPQELVFFFPFYGRTETDRVLTRTYLWPFFNTSLDKRTGQKTYFGYLIPYRFTRGQFDLWPFFGQKRESEGAPLARAGLRERYRHFVLWPIERYDQSEDDLRSSVRFWLLPFFWSFRDRSKTDGAEDREWKLWPFVRYHHTASETTVNFPSPLWFRQEWPFERLYERLWRLFLYRENADEEGWEALFNALHYRNQKRAGIRSFTVLGGLFESETGPQGTGFRFFYLPWKPNG